MGLLCVHVVFMLCSCCLYFKGTFSHLGNFLRKTENKYNAVWTLFLKQLWSIFVFFKLNMWSDNGSLWWTESAAPLSLMNLYTEFPLCSTPSFNSALHRVSALLYIEFPLCSTPSFNSALHRVSALLYTEFPLCSTSSFRSALHRVSALLYTEFPLCSTPSFRSALHRVSALLYIEFPLCSTLFIKPNQSETLEQTSVWWELPEMTGTMIEKHLYHIYYNFFF